MGEVKQTFGPKFLPVGAANYFENCQICPAMWPIAAFFSGARMGKNLGIFP
jgi:hypothetical protein